MIATEALIAPSPKGVAWWNDCSQIGNRHLAGAPLPGELIDADHRASAHLRRLGRLEHLDRRDDHSKMPALLLKYWVNR